jgi:hypothetical protein
MSGASAVFRGFRPAPLPTATTRDRGRLSLIAAIRQEVLGVSGDPDVRQQFVEPPGGLGRQATEDVVVTVAEAARVPRYSKPRNPGGPSGETESGFEVSRF